MFCKHCGKEIADKAVICVHCGCATGYEVRKPKSKTVAFLLWLFLGLIGAHDIYMEHPGHCLTKILILISLSWFFGSGIIIVSIWCILDFFIILGAEDECFLTDEELAKSKI